MNVTFQPRRPFRGHKNPSAAGGEGPPGPAVAHVVSVDRVDLAVVRFVFDLAVEDVASGADLQVNGDSPLSVDLVDDDTVDATYDLTSPAAAVWATAPVNGEPQFVGGAVIETATGPVPAWT